MTNPNEPTLTCSEVVERLPMSARDFELSSGRLWHGTHFYEFAEAYATAILHSWRERRVQELENLLSKRSGCSHCNDSASRITSEEVSTESREGEFEIKQLIEEAHDCIRLYRDRMLEFSDIDALEWKASAAEKAMRGK